MVEVIWTDSAIQDLQEIGEYISKDSPKYAEITVSSLFDAPLILVQHPKAGKMVLEFGIQSIRELIYGSYRIVYEIVDSDQINILTIHNSSRLIKNTFRFEDNSNL